MRGVPPGRVRLGRVAACLSPGAVPNRPRGGIPPRLPDMHGIRLVALCWNQYTDWAALLAAGVRADRLGYDTIWT
jgi:hypothetical protein